MKKRRRAMMSGRFARPQRIDSWLGEIYRQLADKDYAGAIQTCQRILPRIPPGSPHHAEVLEYLGIAHQMLQHLDQAYEVLSQAVSIAPERSELWYDRGLAARYTSRQGRSVRDFERALELEGDPALRKKMAEELAFARQMAEKEMALRGPGFTLEQFIEQEELYQAGVKLMEGEAWGEAELVFRRVIEMGDCREQPWGNLGICLMMQRRYDEAEAAWHRALELNPRYEHAQQNLASLPTIRQTGVLPPLKVTGPFDGHELRKSLSFR
ncbi:MAG: tetratricopeptide repeat protein [Thermoflexales bacterium]|nr:tetratricopeptide repeat protein [Thermoflexales bacterium]